MITHNIKDNQISFISWRFYLICICIAISIIGLIVRVTYLQIIHSDKLLREGNLRSLRVQQIPNIRGMIKDRFGRPLAVSVPVNAIWIDPKEINDHGGINTDNIRWKALSDILSISFDRLVSRINDSSKIRFIYLARQVNPNIGDYIHKLKLPGVYVGQESRRYYPAGQITAHLIGITNIDSQGIEGIEKSFNYWLNGRPGKRIVRKDRFGRIIEDISSINSQEAHDLILSIDERLQTLIYRELSNAVISNKAKSGTAVLVDVNTGEVLAMVNSPSYNPNNISSIKTDIMRNLAITDIFEPGSTVKPMVILTALQLGLVKENSVLNTLPYMIGHHKIKDITNYNQLTITEILQKSSNVGVSKLALAMPISALLETYSKFGLGQSTNLGLVGESNGLYPHKKRWSDIDKAALSYGYGLMATPLQLARVYATIGSMGILRPLSIVRVNSPIAGERVFPESLVRTVVRMMERVAQPGGSGTKAAVNGYRVAIKTGTVKKVGPYGNYINKYIAYTAGIAPASSPRFALVVVINDPQGKKYYGGTVSAPIFSNIMSGVLRIMNIEPDALLQSNRKLHVLVNNQQEALHD